jgi:hypothetical protein
MCLVEFTGSWWRVTSAGIHGYVIRDLTQGAQPWIRGLGNKGVHSPNPES